MSKKIFFLFLIPALLLLESCKKNEEPVNPDINATIKGVVTIAGEGLSGAAVRLDKGAKNQNTDMWGRFEFLNIDQGNHQLDISKDLDDGSSIVYSTTAVINYNNADLGEIKFSRPNTISVDTVSGTSPVIRWSRNSDTDLQSYTLYCSSNTNVNSTNSTLIFQSTQPGDTVYTDKAAVKGTPAYYRVYAIQKSGKTYGSVIDGAYAPPKNYITNGSFENYWNPSFPSNWNYVNQGIYGFSYFKLTKDNAKQGSTSLEVYWTDSVSNYSHQATLYQRIQTSYLTQGKTYRFSFWAKSLSGQIGVYFIVNEKPTLISVPAGSDWTEKSITFQMDQTVQSMRVEVISSGDFSKYVKGWIDNMSLTLVR